MRMATCHPDVKHFGRGLCQKCYVKTPVSIASRERYAKTPAGRLAVKRSRLRKHYGIEYEQYMEMFAAQNGVCAMCGTPPPGTDRLAVDHCHSSGKIRGLLCIPCNLILGNAKDRISTLEAGVRYLTQSRSSVATQ